MEKNTYQQISQDKAKQMMEEQEDAIVLDVREKEEYETGHIPGAVLLPLGTIDEDSAASVIPKKDSVVLVYCRSGRRSKQASQALAELGYTQIYEFGGINDWLVKWALFFTRLFYGTAIAPYIWNKNEETAANVQRICLFR